jgi:1-acyl-sn-glycerol-3-phosphate acyltransferase
MTDETDPPPRRRRVDPRVIGRLGPVARASMAPALRSVFPTRVRGVHHVPTAGPAIIAPNHLSVFDSAVLIGALPRTCTFIGKAEYLDDWKTRTLFPAFGMIPVERSGGGAARAALDEATRVLERGELFVIYPEGTRSRDGLLHRGKTGVARLSLRTGAPIIPVGLRGTDRVQPADQPLPRPFRRVSVSFGEPIDPSVVDDRPGDGMAGRDLTDRVMFEIQRLSRQTYVDAYGPGGDRSDGPDASSRGRLTPERRRSDTVLP